MPMLPIEAHAKINLALRVLNRRPDGFHELRTIFQTISLADRLSIEYRPARRTSVTVASSVPIPGTNLAETAARHVLHHAKKTGEVRIHIEKRIPMGGGLGGGSTDAAAVVRGLAAMVGYRKPLDAICAALGSDVPFFLYGGCALGIGRGEEIYPLPDLPPVEGLLVCPQVHVSTGDAYAALNRASGELTSPDGFPRINKLRSFAWAIANRLSREVWAEDSFNDFEEVVFRQYPVLSKLRRKLSRAGAAPARMTGSGAALFGLFPDAAAVQAAVERFGTDRVVPFSLLSRSRYQSRWRRWLSGLTDQDAIRPAKDTLR